MSCQQSDYTITLGGPIDPQDISFETAQTITISFTPPSNCRCTGVTYTPNPPPTGYPAPSTTSSSITFSNPGSGTTDFDVNVTYVNLSKEAGDDNGNGNVIHPMTGPTTTIKVKPRATCPN
jgi:hypothetical protein